jgi:hypothetical protein|tara:strand:- start:1387 stop:1869 length:483 start_codon:yes stop_codon:yes gene_type:complete
MKTKVTIKSNVYTDDKLRKVTFAYQERDWNIAHDDEAQTWVKEGIKRPMLVVGIHTRCQLRTAGEMLIAAAEHEWDVEQAGFDLNAYGCVDQPYASPMHALPAWEDIKPLDPVEAAKVRTLVAAARSVAKATGCTVEEGWALVAGTRRQPDWRVYPPTAS